MGCNAITQPCLACPPRPQGPIPTSYFSHGNSPSPYIVDLGPLLLDPSSSSSSSSSSPPRCQAQSKSGEGLCFSLLSARRREILHCVLSLLSHCKQLSIVFQSYFNYSSYAQKLPPLARLLNSGSQGQSSLLTLTLSLLTLDPSVSYRYYRNVTVILP